MSSHIVGRQILNRPHFSGLSVGFTTRKLAALARMRASSGASGTALGRGKVSVWAGSVGRAAGRRWAAQSAASHLQARSSAPAGSVRPLRADRASFTPTLQGVGAGDLTRNPETLPWPGSQMCSFDEIGTTCSSHLQNRHFPLSARRYVEKAAGLNLYKNPLRGVAGVL